MADGNRRIARALYERAGREEKRQAKGLFRKLDSDRDGKISGEEFKKGIKSELPNEKVWYKDGWMDLDDVLVVFYYKKEKVMILRCGGCGALIFGPSFCCFRCLFNTVDSRYALCPNCYNKGGESIHHHPLSYTSASASASASDSDQVILLKLSQLVDNHPKPLRKKDMKQLWEKAVLGSGRASSQLEAMANNFFQSVDDKGKVHRQHFSKLMISQQQSELEKFLTHRPDSDATNFMKDKFREAYGLSNSPLATTAAQENSTSTSTSTLTSTSTHHITHHEGSSSKMLKVVTTTFKIVDMALTIASLSSMCTIM